jgi:hypothetical protein
MRPFLMRREARPAAMILRSRRLLIGRTVAVASLRWLRSAIVTPRFGTLSAMLARIARAGDFLPGNAPVVVAVDLAQRLAGPADLIGIERAVAIGVEDGKEI